jgi:hypothetical protein
MLRSKLPKGTIETVEAKNIIATIEDANLPFIIELKKE